MINGYSIRKCAEIVEISVPTSFYWRNKFLDAIRVYMSVGHVGGVKGSMSSPHEKRKRGISKQQVFVHVRLIG